MRYMAGHWFDTLEGKLIVGEAAYQHAVEQSFPGQIVPFREALVGDMVAASTSYYEKAAVDDWTREDYVALGKWALTIINDGTEPEQPFTNTVARRLYLLGLGPEERRYTRSSRFGSLEAYRREIGSPQGRRKYDPSQFTPDKFLKLTSPARESAGRIAVEHYLDELAAKGRTAPGWVWRRHLGNFRPLLDQEGHPDTRNWDTDDYLRWAADFIEINSYELLTPLNVQILGARHRAPWPRSIINHFDNKWRHFKVAAKQYYEEVRRPALEARQKRIRQYREMIAAGTLPSILADSSEHEILAIAGKLRLARRYLPELPENKLLAAARTTHDNFIMKLRDLDDTLDPGTIEATAVMLDIFDDIWPTFSFKKHLHLSDDEIKTARTIRRDKVRHYTDRSRQQAS